MENTQLVLQDSTNTSRFGPLTSEKELTEAAKGVIPNNTICNTRWAEKNFLTLVAEHNRLSPKDPVPLDLLRSHDVKLVCKNS